jgi:plastocyanin
MRSTLALVFAVPVIALLAVAGTRVLEGPSSSGGAVTAGANAVVIKDFAFNPEKLTVTAGSTLKVTNDDGAAHTLTARDGSFNTGDLSGGKATMVSLEKTGTFAYYCKIHDYMTGTLVVK